MTQAPTLVVGIGISSESIPALDGLLSQVPTDTAMAFVIVMRRAHGARERLHGAVDPQTALPSQIAIDGMRVEPGHVYIMPQDTTMTLAGGHLHISPGDLFHPDQGPLDIFLSSLAEDQGENAVGILLSGADADGTLGAKAIKEQGGLTIAEKVGWLGKSGADMPASAVLSGLIDFELCPEDMGPELLRILGTRTALEELTRVGQQEKQNGELRKAQQEIASLLRSRCGHDFSDYKIKTFLRRVTRRMQVCHVETLDGYLERLRQDPSEATALFRDLLINVTDFFRDKDAFAALESTVIPKLFEGRGPGDTIRVWIPGCATGEEVYSIAILLREHMDALSSRPRVQIFATDIDDHALGLARAGRYPEQLLKTLSPERLRRFFRRDGASYVVSKEVREFCIFSSHSVIKDPPFSRMDLVSCRNLLIYFGGNLQQQVIPTFHYALKPGGYLFLGSSESISQFDDLFVDLDKKQRVFQSRETKDRRRLPLHLDGGGLSSPRPHALPQSEGSRYQLRQQAESLVLEQFAPPHVVVGEAGDIQFYSTRTSKFLEAPRGSPSRQLLDLVRRDLKLELRSALREASGSHRPSSRRCVLQSEGSEETEAVILTVSPLEERSGSSGRLLVVFQTAGAEDERKIAAASAEHTKGHDELGEMRERLQSTIEEYETALEELKASNEELISVNEEAQSTNEELEASKEEMQSLNEELSTINFELNAKVEELDRAHADLANLYEATQIATVFLDGKLVIRSFTPAASSFFNLRASDIGRPLTDLASTLDYAAMQDHIITVYRTGTSMENTIEAADRAAHYLVRMNPYRGADDGVKGVVVSFVDISRLAAAEAQQGILIAELNHRVKNMLAVILSIVSSTLRNAKSPEAFAETLTGRLGSMARSYELLSRSSWTRVSMSDLTHLVASTYGTRIKIAGADLKLQPQEAQAIAMVFHELATNAAKYGALSVDEGRVTLEWKIAGNRLNVQWREFGGPKVEPPDRKGFGLTLIEGQIKHQLQGEMEARYDPDGFSMTFTFPLEAEHTFSGPVAVTRH